jgi:hypothetical protein
MLAGLLGGAVELEEADGPVGGTVGEEKFLEFDGPLGGARELASFQPAFRGGDRARSPLGPAGGAELLGLKLDEGPVGITPGLNVLAAAGPLGGSREELSPQPEFTAAGPRGGERARSPRGPAGGVRRGDHPRRGGDRSLRGDLGATGGLLSRRIGERILGDRGAECDEYGVSGLLGPLLGTKAARAGWTGGEERLEVLVELLPDCPDACPLCGENGERARCKGASWMRSRSSRRGGVRERGRKLPLGPDGGDRSR